MSARTVVVIAAFVVLLAASSAWAVLSLGTFRGVTQPAAGSTGPLPAASLLSQDGSASAPATPSLEGTASAADIEVPLLAGKSIQVAEALVTAAGLTAQTRVADPVAPGVEPGVVVSQWPEAMARVRPGAEVVITYQARSVPAAEQYTVVIDAGHQKKANLALEPIGPGSTERKPKVQGGATGVSTLIPEYKQTLAIALKLRDALVAKGVKVVMVRTTNDVDIPNSQRAKIGNDAKADLVVRIHLNGSSDNGVRGVMTLYGSGNSWVAPIAAASKKAATIVHAAVLKSTGARSAGIVGTSKMSGFNYSTRPSIIVECGYMSNPAEDKLIATDAYQQKVVDGITTGAMSFLQGS